MQLVVSGLLLGVVAFDVLVTLRLLRKMNEHIELLKALALRDLLAAQRAAQIGIAQMGKRLDG